MHYEAPADRICSQMQGGMATIDQRRVRQIEHRALVKLRRNPSLIRWHGYTLQERAWHGTGFMAWKSGGSVAERAIEYLERKGAYILEVESQNQ